MSHLLVCDVVEPLDEKLARLDRAMSIHAERSRDPEGNDWSRRLSTRHCAELLGARLKLMRGGVEAPSEMIYDWQEGKPEDAPSQPLARKGTRFHKDMHFWAAIALIVIVLSLYAIPSTETGSTMTVIPEMCIRDR